MSDRERAKEWIDEISSNDVDRVLYFMNLVLTKKGLFNERCELKKEIERLNKIIKEAREYIESYMPNYDFDKTNLIKLLEILDKENNDNV